MIRLIFCKLRFDWFLYYGYNISVIFYNLKRKTMKSVRPENPSKLEYFQLSREFNARGLLYGKYKNLMRYRERYEKIKNHRKFDESLIKNKQR